MKTIGVIPNLDKDKELKYTRRVIEIIHNKGMKANLPIEFAKRMGLESQRLDEEEVLKQSEVIICLGGDGTFLNVARKAYKKSIPILGINLGNLGFLTEIEKNDIEKAIDHLANDNYLIEERMMLESAIYNNKKELVANDIALNDVVISNGAISRILHLKTYINNVFADTFPGDGLIVSSPTGSTAYSLSAGGPIVEPDLDIIVVTPICPHILYSRSLVTTGDRVVKVVVDEKYRYDAMVTCDGQKGFKIKGGYSIEVKKAPFSVKLIRINSRNFFNVLRTKMYERGECFREDEI